MTDHQIPGQTAIEKARWVAQAYLEEHPDPEEDRGFVQSVLQDAATNLASGDNPADAEPSYKVRLRELAASLRELSYGPGDHRYEDAEAIDAALAEIERL